MKRISAIAALTLAAATASVIASRVSSPEHAAPARLCARQPSDGGECLSTCGAYGVLQAKCATGQCEFYECPAGP